MNQEEFEEKLLLYLYEELDEEEREKVENHLKVSPTSRKLLEDHRKVMDFEMLHRPTGQAPKFKRKTFWIWPGAAAAVLALGIGLWSMGSGERTFEDPTMKFDPFKPITLKVTRPKTFVKSKPLLSRIDQKIQRMKKESIF